jgi:hypothetical protein
VAATSQRAAAAHFRAGQHRVECSREFYSSAKETVSRRRSGRAGALPIGCSDDR